MCKKCHLSCLECNGPTSSDCTKCIIDKNNPLNTLYLDQTINKCLNKCPEGTTYLFGEEGLDMYLPGNGILFEDGIHATIANTTGVTITFT